VTEVDPPVSTQADIRTEPLEFDRTTRSRQPRRVGPIRRAGLGVSSFLLAGLTTMEIIAAAVGMIAVTTLLWATETVSPERLVTGSGFRSAWILLVLALIRPVTWIPYVALFLLWRPIWDAVIPGVRTILRNALAHAATVGVLAGVSWVVVNAVRRAGTAVLSAMAFATGSGSYDTLGTFRGDWTTPRVGLVVVAVVLVRLFLPPIGTDLDLSRQPVLGFAEGGRGRFDRILLVVVTAAAVVLGTTAFLVGRS
jgi:hypothetical protein